MNTSHERPALFVGGITGRTGTSWVVDSIAQAAGGTHASVVELGIFVLSQFRGAPYDFYQFGFGPPRELPTAFQKYFKEFFLSKAYNRREIYGSGLRGIQPYLPIGVVERMLEKFAANLERSQTLKQGYECLGNFYTDILDEISRRHFNSRIWISKEPSYGRHANELLAMVPNARLLVMARDGRDVVLSMQRKHGSGPLTHFIDRYNEFTDMTLKALAACPSSQNKIVRYEDLVSDFDNQMGSILEFYGITRKAVDLSLLPGSSRPRGNSSVGGWKLKMAQSDIQYFEATCDGVMEKLGYPL